MRPDPISDELCCADRHAEGRTLALLAQFVGMLLLVGFVGAYFWWIVYGQYPPTATQGSPRTSFHAPAPNLARVDWGPVERPRRHKVEQCIRSAHTTFRRHIWARANSALLLGASAVTVRLQKIERNSFRRSKRSGLAYARSDDARRPARRTSVPAVGVRSNSVCQTLKLLSADKFSAQRRGHD